MFNQHCFFIINKILTSMKASIIMNCGNVPEKPLSCIKFHARIDAKDGQIAHDKFKALTGEDFSVGAVIHIPTSNPDLLLKHLKLDALAEKKPPFVDIKTLAHSDGLYGYLNVKIEETPAPPNLIGLSINTPVSFDIDIISGRTSTEIINFIKEEASQTSDTVFSRFNCSLYSDFRLAIKLDIPPESVEEVYAQIKDLIPIPLPVDPTIGARILENLEYDIDFDSFDSLPKVFQNEFWDKNGAENLKKISRAYFRMIEKVFGENSQETLKEIIDSMTSQTVLVHLFAKNWGHVTLEITFPGLNSLIHEVKSYL